MLGDIISGVGSLVGGMFGDDDAKANRATQVALAKNSVKLRVDDAKRSGVHPLYALGAPTMSFNPVSSPMGQSIQNATSKIGNAISTTYEKQLQAKNLDNIQADIDLKKAQTMNFVSEYKKSSNLSRTNDTGRTAGSSRIAGDNVKHSKNWDDAQKIEDRYGDLVSWLYGLGVVTADGVPHLEKKQKSRPWEEDYKHYGGPKVQFKKWFQK